MFGQRILSEGGAHDEDRLAFTFTAATSRPPKPAEFAVLRDVSPNSVPNMLPTGQPPDNIENGKAPPPKGLIQPNWQLDSLANILLNLDKPSTGMSHPEAEP